MKNFRYILFFALAGFIAPSCVDDTAPEDAFGTGPNLAAFSRSTMNFSVVATGEEYVQEVPVKVKGPSTREITSPVTATISVDPSSTAVEGVHFRLDQNTVQISPDNNLLAKLPITVLTAGVDAPLAETPVLVLKVSGATGANNVIAGGQTVSINLNYLCDSNLQGNYIVTITRNDSATPNVYDEVIGKTGSGQYRGTSVGHYAPGSLGGNPGFTFLDVCGVITVPKQNLVDLYSNEVYGIGESYVDAATGNLHIEYEITFAAGNRQYVAEYVKQ
jgi:hypothetical protein